MRIIKENSLGLIIDMQERLLPHIYHSEEIISNTGICIEGLKLLDIPLLSTEQYRKGLGPTVQELQNKIEVFNPIEKMTFSCCDEPGFLSQLKSMNKGQLIICGIEAHVCILQTTIDLIHAGYQPVVIEDCISSRKNNDKIIAVERMRQEGAIITTYESVLFEIARISGTDSFKAISRLVK